MFLRYPVAGVLPITVFGKGFLSARVVVKNFLVGLTLGFIFDIVPMVVSEFGETLFLYVCC